MPQENAKSPAGEAKPPRLTANQKRFVEEYAIDRNAVQAYFRAYGRTTSKGKRRSYKSAQKAASRLVSNVIIAEEIAAAEREHRRRCRVTVERIVRHLAAVAFADPDDVYEADPDNGGLPTPRPWRDIPPAARRTIAGVKIKRRRLASDKDETAWEIEEISYKHRDPDAAIDKLMRRLGLYRDLPPLEQILATLPADLGRALREALAASVSGGSNPGGNGTTGAG